MVREWEREEGRDERGERESRCSVGERGGEYLRFSKREEFSVHTRKFKPRKCHLYINNKVLER